MRKDPTEFRERFARWKNGEQVYKAGLPHYEDGKDVTYDAGWLPEIVVTPRHNNVPSLQNAVKTKVEYDMLKDFGLFDDDDNQQDYLWYSMLNNNSNPFYIKPPRIY